LSKKLHHEEFAELRKQTEMPGKNLISYFTPYQVQVNSLKAYFGLTEK
jgi:hypothetical protein